jgi:leucyl/phenylalanyl-tRNA--protein transferase
MVAFLEKKLWFPDPRTYDRYLDEGLLAVGGDMSVERLKLAYRLGIFPWTEKPITWWCPDPRGIFDLQRLRISRSLAKFIRKKVYHCTFDQAFEQVIRACAETPRPGSWITESFIQAYVRLHEAGAAHSVECWHGDRLVGGVYGVAVEGLFAGESMFYRASNASKVALVHLTDHLNRRGYQLFDVQMITPVTESLGARLVARNDYLSRLKAALSHPCTFGGDEAESGREPRTSQPNHPQ